MSKKFTFSKGVLTPSGEETFTAVEFDSFDEAIKAVEKGLHNRELELTPKVNPLLRGLPGIDKGDQDIVKDTKLSEGTHQPEKPLQ